MMWERNIEWLPVIHTPKGDWTHIWNQNCKLLGVWDDAPSNWATLSGLAPLLLNGYLKYYFYFPESSSSFHFSNLSLLLLSRMMTFPPRKLLNGSSQRQMLVPSSAYDWFPSAVYLTTPLLFSLSVSQNTDHMPIIRTERTHHSPSDADKMRCHICVILCLFLLPDFTWSNITWSN